MAHMDETHVKIWDLPVRLFHWALVICFGLTYLAAEVHLLNFHVWLGYVLLALLVFRLFWGFAGNSYARFKSFLFSPQETMIYVRSMRNGPVPHYYGHNPAGALMVFSLLALLMSIFMLGFLTLGVVDYEGPLLFLANRLGDNTAYFFRHAHVWLVNAALVLIPLHLLGVIVGSIQHHENLVRAMVTGMKRKV
ncbi:cytochrome b/b6 domain-containing protein [Ferrigenium sp. UT5]